MTVHENRRWILNQFFTLLGSALFLLLFVVSPVCRAQRTLPECPPGSPAAPSRAVAARIPIPDDVANVFRARDRYDIVVEARFDRARRPSCVSFLSSTQNSLLWPYVMNLLESGMVGSPESHEVLMFDDPVFNSHKANRNEIHQCSGSEDVPTALSLGSAAIFAKRYSDATECFNQARRLRPDSPFAEYGLATAAGLERNTAARIEHYGRASDLLPTFWEARIQLGIAQNYAGDTEAAQRTFLDILAASPPLPVRSDVYYWLVYLNDGMHRRREAAVAKSSYLMVEEERRARHEPLVDEYTLASDAEDLAAREEEIGDQQAAAQFFEETVQRASRTKLADEAMRFHADLGRLRAIKRLGQAKAWKTHCDGWSRRLRELSLRFVTRDLEGIDWGGKAVATGEWEIACGDFQRGLNLINAEIRQRTVRPYSYSHSIPAETFFAEAPYKAMERTFRSIGQSDLADAYAALRQRIPSARDTKELNDIVDSSEDLFRKGKLASPK